MRLIEIFDSPTEYTWKNEDVASFNVDGETYEFAAKVGRDDVGGVAQIGFYLVDDYGDGTVGHEYEETGYGDSVPIMSTVINIIKEWISKNPDVTKIWWMADGDSRNKLYNRIAKRFAGNDWQLDGTTMIHTSRIQQTNKLRKS